MTLAIQLPEELSQFVREQMDKHGYPNASVYFSALLEAEQRRRFREELEQSLIKAVSEPSTPLTSQDFEDIRREGMALIEQRRAK